MKFMTNHIYKFAMLCLITASANASSAFVSVGYFSNSNNKDKLKPLIIAGNNTTQPWSQINNIENLPLSWQDASLRDVQCKDDYCIATGRYSLNNSNESLPLLLVSDNKGQSWSIANQIKDQPSDLKAGSLYSTACTGTVCVAVGYYTSDTHLPESLRTNKPLVLASNDKGQTWAVNQSIQTIPDGFKGATLSKVTCDDRLCVAAGSYKRYTPNQLPYYTKQPFLLLSTDQGKSWTYRNVANLPEQLIDISFNMINCQDGICVAGGSYDSFDHGYGNIPQPFIMTSRDNATTFDFTNPLPERLNNKGDIKKIVMADKQTWIAVGAYNNYFNWESLIAISKNQGRSWSLIRLEDTPYIALNDIDCNTSMCVAGGPLAGKTPVLLITHDKGLTWKLIKKFKSGSGETISGDISSVLCTEDDCVAFGWSYVNTYVNKPLLLISHDKGLTWNYLQRFAGMPSNFREGALLAAALI